MLELLAFYFLGKKVRDIAAAKGRDGNVFLVLFIGLWLLGEVGGLLFGLVLTGGDSSFLGHYAIALLGAAGGAFLVYTIVASLPDTPYGERKRNRDSRPRRPMGGTGQKRARPAEGTVYAFQDSTPARRRKKSSSYQTSY
jgi:hypothetical protein